MTVDFKFAVGETVRLRAMDVQALVQAVSIGLAKAAEYEVSYWFDGERKREWVFEQELAPCSKN